MSFVNSDFNEKLLAAARAGNRSEVMECLDKRADIECFDPANGSTPLMTASRVGSKHVVEYLLKRGASIEATDSYGRSALHLAAWKGRTSVVEFLLMKAEEKEIPIVNMKTNGADCPLHEAAEFGHMEVCKLLIERGAKVEAESWDGTPLCKAAKEGHHEIVALLLANGANPNKINPNGKSSAFHLAVVNGHVKVINSILAHKGRKSTEIGDANEWKPIHLAARNGDLACLSALLQGGARIEATNNELFTPLILSASAGHVDAVAYLLEQGANIHAENCNRNTALHMACLNCFDEVVALLVGRGASLGAVNIGKSTPLLVSVSEGDMESVVILLDRGADINAADHHGNTALIRAASNNFLGLVELLLLRGGPALDVDAVNKEGKSAYWVAEELGFVRICNVIYPPVSAEGAEVGIEAVAAAEGEGKQEAK